MTGSKKLGFYLFIGVISLFGTSTVTGQGTNIKASPTPKLINNPAKALSIGEEMPNVIFNNILNYKSRTAALNDFKGKLIILDLWNITCSSCINAFPKLEAIQNKFQDKIQILLVNPHDPKFNSKSKIISVLEKIRARTGFYPSLPMPLYDSILNDYFPHKTVPHQVWIDASGKIIAITESNEVNETNIIKALERKNLNLPIKDDWKFDRNKPLFVQGGDADNFIYRSIFSNYLGGIGISSGTRRNEKNQITGFFIINHPLRYFINLAYLDLINQFDNSRIILDVKNELIYKNDVEPSNYYCYDLTMPPISHQLFKVDEILKEDLRRVFNIKVFKEKRSINCIVLVNYKKKNSRNQNSKQELDLDENTRFKFMHNYPIEDVISIFNSQLQIPIINEISGLSKVSIDFPPQFDFKNTQSVIDVLNKEGFDIQVQERNQEVVIITDK